MKVNSMKWIIVLTALLMRASRVEGQSNCAITCTVSMDDPFFYHSILAVGVPDGYCLEAAIGTHSAWIYCTANGVEFNEWGSAGCWPPSIQVDVNASSAYYGCTCDHSRDCPPPPIDTDGDTVEDDNDNCPNDYNPDQADGDMDLVGDACDNCPDDYNPEQADGDMDFVGDVCEAHPPTANDDSYSVNEDATLYVLFDQGVLINDYDMDGDALTVTSNTAPSAGTADVENDGSFWYQPNANFHGTDSFSYTVSDGPTTDTAMVTITVNSVNDPPTANDDNYSTDQDVPLLVPYGIGLLINDYDVDDDTIGIFSNTSPSDGTALVATDGHFMYTPNSNWFGTDSFSYTLSDVNGDTDTATVTITVIAAPTASPTPNPTPSPTANPTPNPTPSPTANPTSAPTPSPTTSPTPNPTPSPTASPTSSPTDQVTGAQAQVTVAQAQVDTAQSIVDVLCPGSNSTKQQCTTAREALRAAQKTLRESKKTLKQTKKAAKVNKRRLIK